MRYDVANTGGSDVVSWEQRLRDIILAGGGLTAVACAQASAPDTDAASVGPPFVCCNGNLDPCCPLGCDEPITPACAQSECQSDGGTWSFMDGTCLLPSEDGSLDALVDAGGTDTGADAGIDDATMDAGVMLAEDARPNDAGPEAHD
jgi:hypothetical protein